MINTNEKELVAKVAMARQAITGIHKTYVGELMTEKRPYADERRRLATCRTHIAHVGAMILASGTDEERKKNIRDVETRLRRVRGFRAQANWGEDLKQPVRSWFSMYALVYCALRDTIVYFERHPDRLAVSTKEVPDLRKAILQRARTAQSNLRGLFKDEVDYGLAISWSDLEFQLENEIKPYQFEVCIILV